MNVHLKLFFFIINFLSISCSWFDKDDEVATVLDESSPVSIADYPYIASIVKKVYSASNQFLCAGTIIGQYHGYGIVLTTGTCLARLTMEKILIKKIRLRTNSEYWEGCECELAQEYRIDFTLLHPKFASHSHVVGENDVGLVIIKGKWRGPYDKKTRDSTLGMFRYSSNQKLFTLGWGITRRKPIKSTDLRKTEHLMIIPKNICSKYFEYFLSNQTFCVASEDPKKGGPCHFNQGGPLLDSDSNGTVLQGIALYAPTCEEEAKPAVIVNISYHRTFLLNISSIPIP